MGKRVNTAKWIDAKKTWRIDVQKDGRRRSFYSSKPGRTGQREANAKADAWLDDGIDSQKLRVKDLWEDYIELLKATTGQAHWRKEESIGRVWILPTLAGLKIEKLTETHLQNILLSAAKSSKMDPSKGLSKKSLYNLRAAMLAFVKYCRVRRKATSLHPEVLDIPKSAAVGERKILQPAHLITLFTEDTTILFGNRVFDRYIHAYRYQVLTGLRPGELIGLEQDDIVGDKVQLHRSVNDLGEITDGKNANARRSFVMVEQAVEEIRKQRGIYQGKRVFDISSGITYRRRWKRYCESNGIPYITPYEMRHTFVSVMKGLPEGELKALVGHSKDMDTYGVYSHEVDGDKRRIAQKMESIFSALLGKPIG